MSFDFNQESFGDVNTPDISGSRTWNDVWPSSSTSWDRFDPKQGFDMTGATSFQPFQLANDKQERPANYRVSNFGAEFSRPHEAEQGPEGHLLFPFGEGPLNPRTAYDFWNPAQALDTLATWARIIPGVNDAGNYLGQLGKSIADSWVGKTISESPLAAAGSFVGDTLFGIMKGGFQTVGDMLSPLGDVAKSYQERDFGGAALALAHVGPWGLGEKTAQRINGLIHGDEQLKEQLADEFGFLLTLGTLGAGAATGVLAKGATTLSKQAARIGVLKAAQTTAEEGLSYSLNPILHNIAVATKFGLAGGYGLEAGSEVAAHLFPNWDNTNQFIASQTLVPKDSPFRGAFEMGAAAFVDPMPALGAIAENPAVRKLMDSGFLRLPSPVERLAADMPGGWTGVQNKKALVQELYAAGLERVALKKLEDEGFREIKPSDLKRRVEELRQTLTVDGERKFQGLASDHTNLQAAITKEIHSWKQEMEKHFPEYANTPMTMKDFESHWNEIKQNWETIKAHQQPGSQEVLMVRKDVLVDTDVQNMINDLHKLQGFNPKSNKRLTDQMRQAIAKDHKDVIDHLNKNRQGLLNMSQAKLVKELQGVLKHLPKEANSGSVAAASALIRGQGRYKVIVKGSNPVIKDVIDPITKKVIKDAGDVEIGRFHPAAREAEELLKRKFEDGESVTLRKIRDLYEAAGKQDAERLLEKWNYDHTAMYSADGVLRPVLTPNKDLAMLMPEGATRLGTMVSNFREYIPNTELSRKFKDKFFEVHNKELGATREEVDALIKALREEADKAQTTTINQWAAGNTPHNAGKPIKELYIQHFGLARLGGRNPSQLLEKSMPTESWSKLVKVLIGSQPGEVGIAPSLFGALRAKRADRTGDFYRWWAHVGHPALRYDTSPLFLLQLPFESKIYNFLRGAKNPSTDGLLAPAINEAIDKVAKEMGGKTMGEQRNIGMLPAETSASERVSARSGASPSALRNQVDYMFKQVMQELPERFADRMRLVMPDDYKLLRREYKSNKELMNAVVYDHGLKKQYLAGDISKDKVYSLAKIAKNSKAVETFNILDEQLQSAMRDAVRQAQTTHISNPMRRYWERSFSHPVLMYPLSWTLKATGEWARFLTHSAFGLRTGMAGNVGWAHLQDATMRALVSDPDAMDWVKNHPETIKIMEYILPGLPGSPIPGDKAGVGFGLLSVPLRNAVQTGANMMNGRPLEENMSDMSKIGLLRDFKVGPKLWSEWVAGKPQTSIDNAGLTVGKKKYPQAFDDYVNEQLGLQRR